jgi:DNA-binding NarL/FixJ family response regulator
VTLASRDLNEAREATDTLRALAAAAGTAPLDALATAAAGQLALSSGDPEIAAGALATAAAAFDELGLPYEAARARVARARALRDVGDASTAEPELERAAAALRRLGAEPELAEIDRLRRAHEAALPAGLTAREAEVLRLVAEGKTNRDIAVELVISEHTVARHLQNMFVKLGVSSRSGATAFAFEHGLA